TSGIANYEHNLSSTAGCSGDVLGNTPVAGTSTSRTVGTPLSNGATYFNCVRAWDVAGNNSTFLASNGFTVDTVAPSIATASVLDGSTGPDAQYQGSTSTVNVRWSGFTDAGGSGIANYDWGLSTAADCSSFVTMVSGVGTGGGFS